MAKKEWVSESNQRRRKNYVGQKFGKLTVLEEDGMVNKGYAYRCLCDCGNIRRHVNGHELKRGCINSCGCSFPAGHCRPGKTQEEYFEHVKKELLSKRNIIADCWEFTGYIDPNGYGRRTFTIDGKKSKQPVSRISYRLWKGPIEEGLHVCHTCDNTKCFNPDHLWLGTPKDNIHDMIEKGRSPSRKGENGGKAKLTEKDVLEIRQKYADGEKMSVMARKYNVTDACIDYICKRKTWKHV